MFLQGCEAWTRLKQDCKSEAFKMLLTVGY